MTELLNLRHRFVKILFFVALLLLAVSIVLAVVSLFPVLTGHSGSSILINDSFHLSPGEVRRQGIGSFYGGENISVSIHGLTVFPKNFSIVTYNGLRFANFTEEDIGFTFPAGADYYEAVFFSNSTSAGEIHFEVTVQAQRILYPFLWLTSLAKIIFFGNLIFTMLILLNNALSQSSEPIRGDSVQSLTQKNRRRLIILLVISLIFWFSLLAVNTNPLATYENWYTDHVRHSYTSALFGKVGFSVFNKPLGELASLDNSYFKFVTWPEMPHLYPLGSIALFLPFGAALQNGLDPVLVYKLEMSFFIVVSHICLYYFLKYFIIKDLEPSFKLAGIYVIYVPLVVFAANGMFDSVAFLFSLFGLIMFIEKRYDYFFLLIAASIMFKYQAGVFLFPLILAALWKLFEKYRLRRLIRNKLVVVGAVLLLVSVFTAYLSAPFLLQTRPQLIMNGISAFASNAQIPWHLQSFSVLLTLVATIIFVLYMLNKNSLLSLSALFLLFPSFTLPYFQNWYLPFIFVYILIPQKKKELHATIIWLIFIIVVLSFGGIAYNPLNLFNNLMNILRNFAGSFSSTV